jgi:fumarylacetoacetase
MRIAIPPESQFGLGNLPYGVFSPPRDEPRVGVRVADSVVDLARLTGDPAFATASLNAFMAQGPARWAQVRHELTAVLAADLPDDAVHPLDDVTMHLPVEVADYVDFYASEHHAANVGRLFRPGGEPLLPNWKHLPVGYHGRAGTVVVSGTGIVRPLGQHRPDEDGNPASARRAAWTSRRSSASSSAPDHHSACLFPSRTSSGTCSASSW